MIKYPQYDIYIYIYINVEYILSIYGVKTSTCNYNFVMCRNGDTDTRICDHCTYSLFFVYNCKI